MGDDGKGVSAAWRGRVAFKASGRSNGVTGGLTNLAPTLAGRYRYKAVNGRWPRTWAVSVPKDTRLLLVWGEWPTPTKHRDEMRPPTVAVGSHPAGLRPPVY